MFARGLWGGPKRAVVLACALVAGTFVVPIALADPPTFTPNPPPDPPAAEATSAAGATVNYSLPAATDTEGPPTVACLPVSGSVFVLGNTTVNCTATDTTDSTTSSASFNVVVHDTTPPTITPGGSQLTVSATGPAGATVNYAGFVTVSDLVDPSPALNCMPASGSVFSIGPTTVNCMATDAASNSSSASFIVVVADTTAPVISNVPANITTNATGASTTVSYASPTATDNVDPSVSVNCAPASGSGFPVGTTTVTCNAQDAAGNIATPATFIVTVKDTLAPVITNVPSIPPVNASGPTTPVLYTPPTATDNVDGNVPVLCAPAPGAAFPLGTTPVNCTATDSSGNSASASFSVIVADKTAPTLNLPASASYEATSSAGAPVSFSASATDNVDPNPSVSCTPAAGSVFALGQTTVSCTAKDASNNTSSPGTFTVTVVDTTPPAFSGGPGLISVEANGPSGSHVTYGSPSATDLVDGPLPVLCSPSTGSNFPLGTTTVTCIATDAHGNRNTATFPLRVVDTTPPVLAIPSSITVYTTSSAGCPLPCPPVQSWANSATAVDLVDPSPKVTTTGLADVIPIGVNPVNFTATDSAGNHTSAVSTVTVIYEPSGTSAPPVVPSHVVPPDNVRGLAAKAGNGFVLLTWTNPPSSDHIVVYRSLPTDSGIGSAIYTGPAAQYRDTGLQNDTQYRYVVVTYDKAGNRSVGVAILATPSVPKLMTPVDGALIKRPPVLTWVSMPGVAYWNVQIFLDSQVALTSDFASHSLRVLSAWPTSTKLALHKTWRYSGRKYKLKPGIYRWFVWPGYGARSENNYGPLLGQSTFVVRK